MTWALLDPCQGNRVLRRIVGCAMRASGLSAAHSFHSIVRHILTAAPPGVVLQTPDRGVERISHRHVDVFVRWVIATFSTYDDLAIGHFDHQADLIGMTFVVMVMRSFDGHVAALNAVVESLEFFSLFVNSCLDGGGAGDTSERHFDRNGHGHLG